MAVKGNDNEAVDPLVREARRRSLELDREITPAMVYADAINEAGPADLTPYEALVALAYGAYMGPDLKSWVKRSILLRRAKTTSVDVLTRARDGLIDKGWLDKAGFHPRHQQRQLYKIVLPTRPPDGQVSPENPSGTRTGLTGGDDTNPSVTRTATRPSGGHQPVRDADNDSLGTLITSPQEEEVDRWRGEDPIYALADELAEDFPAFTKVDIRRALLVAAIDRPVALVATAARICFADPKTHSAGRLPHNGPWWRKAADQIERSAPRQREPVPEPEAVPEPPKPCDHGVPDGRGCDDCLDIEYAAIMDRNGGKVPPYLRDWQQEICERVLARRATQPDPGGHQ